MDGNNADWQAYVSRIRRVTQVIGDLCRKPWTELRILDLGSLEGDFAIEFALKGAQVVAIEGRESNNAKARAAAVAKQIDTIEFVTDDVRNLRLETHGKFDVVFCSGLLYHLSGEDGCRLVHTISEICDHLTIIDTHVGLTNFKSVRCNGKTYSGIVYQEHASTDSREVKLERAWSSLDNETSFWITKPSLMNLLRDAKFTSVFEVFRPVSFFGPNHPGCRKRNDRLGNRRGRGGRLSGALKFAGSSWTSTFSCCPRSNVETHSSASSTSASGTLKRSTNLARFLR
jgi:SAM-dependent methyltransferase